MSIFGVILILGELVIGDVWFKLLAGMDRVKCGRSKARWITRGIALIVRILGKLVAFYFSSLKL